MSYEIAIPSYKRSTILEARTLATLVRFGVDLDRVTVWTADDEERETYESELTHKVRVRTARPGILAARQFYHRAYPEGTKIVNLDDDISDIRQKADDKLGEPEFSFDRIVEMGFDVCKKTNAKIWGLNPVSNGFFMKDHITVGLRYICAIFFGSYAGDREMVGERIVDGSGSGEDFEMSIKSFIAHGSTVRLEFLTPLTKYFAAGGIDAHLAANGINRADDHLRQLRAIELAYPDHCGLYTKSGGVSNLRLQRITHARIPLAAVR